MCLTSEALVLFLSLLSPDIVERTEDRIVVRAETRDAVWLAKGDQWCSAAPKIDATLRLGIGEQA